MSNNGEVKKLWKKIGLSKKCLERTSHSSDSKSVEQFETQKKQSFSMEQPQNASLEGANCSIVEEKVNFDELFLSDRCLERLGTGKPLQKQSDVSFIDKISFDSLSKIEESVESKNSTDQILPISHQRFKQTQKQSFGKGDKITVKQQVSQQQKHKNSESINKTHTQNHLRSLSIPDSETHNFVHITRLNNVCYESDIVRPRRVSQEMTIRLNPSNKSSDNGSPKNEEYYGSDDTFCLKYEIESIEKKAPRQPFLTDTNTLEIECIECEEEVTMSLHELQNYQKVKLTYEKISQSSIPNLWIFLQELKYHFSSFQKQIQNDLIEFRSFYERFLQEVVLEYTHQFTEEIGYLYEENHHLQAKLQKRETLIKKLQEAIYQSGEKLQESERIFKQQVSIGELQQNTINELEEKLEDFSEYENRIEQLQACLATCKQELKVKETQISIKSAEIQEFRKDMEIKNSEKNQLQQLVNQLQDKIQFLKRQNQKNILKNQQKQRQDAEEISRLLEENKKLLEQKNAPEASKVVQNNLKNTGFFKQPCQQFLSLERLHSFCPDKSTYQKNEIFQMNKILKSVDKSFATAKTPISMTDLKMPQDDFEVLEEEESILRNYFRADKTVKGSSIVAKRIKTDIQNRDISFESNEYESGPKNSLQDRDSPEFARNIKQLEEEPMADGQQFAKQQKHNLYQSQYSKAKSYYDERKASIQKRRERISKKNTNISIAPRESAVGDKSQMADEIVDRIRQRLKNKSAKSSVQKKQVEPSPEACLGSTSPIFHTDRRMRSEFYLNQRAGQVLKEEPLEGDLILAQFYEKHRELMDKGATSQRQRNYIQSARQSPLRYKLQRVDTDKSTTSRVSSACFVAKGQGSNKAAKSTISPRSNTSRYSSTSRDGVGFDLSRVNRTNIELLSKAHQQQSNNSCQKDPAVRGSNSRITHQSFSGGQISSKVGFDLAAKGVQQSIKRELKSKSYSNISKSTKTLQQLTDKKY